MSMDDASRYIMAIAEYGSISKAARSIPLSQPALSQKLKQQEERLGVKLFERGKTEMRPTQAGRAYLSWARRAQESEQCMRQEIAAILRHESRELVVGVSAPRAERALPSVVDRFMTETDGCLIKFVSVPSEKRAGEMLASRQIDFSVLTPTRPNPSIFFCPPFYGERLMLLAPASWNLQPCGYSKACGDGRGEAGAIAADGRLPDIPIVSPEAIAGRRFIMPPADWPLRESVETLLAAASIEPNVVVEASGEQFGREMVKRGVGMMVAPVMPCAAGEDPDISCFGIEGFSKWKPLYFSCRYDWEPGSDALRFISLIEEALGAKIPSRSAVV